MSNGDHEPDTWAEVSLWARSIDQAKDDDSLNVSVTLECKFCGMPGNLFFTPARKDIDW